MPDAVVSGSAKSSSTEPVHTGEFELSAGVGGVTVFTAMFIESTAAGQEL